MLKSIFKNNMLYENNVNRKAIKKNTKDKIIILSLVLISFTIIMSFYNSKQYNSSLKIVIQKTNLLLINYGFVLNQINISGERNIPKEDILSIFNAQEYKTIFDINLVKIYNNLLLNKWIETVQIERILPNSIKIKIVEKKPLAIWQTKSGNKLITKSGQVISIIKSTLFQNQLPIIIGEEGNKNAFLILQILKEIPDLYKNVWSLSYINKRRWNIHLKQGITILLPKEKMKYAWRKIHKLQKKYKILDLGLTEIDIRNQNQLFGKINFDKKLYLKKNNYDNN